MPVTTVTSKNRKRICSELVWEIINNLATTAHRPTKKRTCPKAVVTVVTVVTGHVTRSVSGTYPVTTGRNLVTTQKSLVTGFLLLGVFTEN